jgi:translation initiation factor IF-2
MAGKKFYRLFKVAKELNVGTSLLVEHLQEQGQEVANAPNTKLSGDQYDLLLKEFASEKLMREKAEQLSEMRKMEVQTNLKTSTSISPPKAKEEESDAVDRDVVSADQLRSNLLPQTPKAKTTSTPPPAPILETPPPPPPAVPTETPPKEEAPVPEEKPEENGTASGLKVLGKIDLEDLNKGKRPPKEPKKESPKVEAPEKTPAKKTPVKKEKVEEPVAEKAPVAPEVVETKPEVKAPSPETTAKPEAEAEAKTEETSQKKKLTPAEEKAEPVAEKPATVESTPVEIAAEDTEAETEPKEEKETIIRAGDSTPQLSGLKVMGKIDLPGAKSKRKADAKQESKPSDKGKTTEEAGEGDGKKKRRRRRKRKRKSAAAGTTPGSQQSGQDKRSGGKGKKEKPSQAEVDQSIKTTLSQMGRSTSRQRQRLRRAKRDADAQRREQQQMADMEQSRVLDLTEFITANEFADLIEVPVNDIITKSFQLGTMISINQRLDAELLSIIAEEYGFEANFVDASENEFDFDLEEDDPGDLVTRNPIITVMGHVDHGKTTLLDFLRKANVTASEAGGITQHIGAYEVVLKSGRHVTFLDTPGHEAFTAMRARGAKATDVSIIVISADDAVMPQTREAINHSQAAEVPMIFAFNKMDKAGADAERIKGQLAEMNILVEDWGGSFQSQEISALKGTGVDDLLEKVILESDMLELKANPDREASGVVIEARLDRGRGNVATLLVQNGTLRVGDDMVAGIYYGRVRALINQNGERVEEAGPAMPVQVLGLHGSPTAGDRFQVFSDEGKAKDLAQKRSELYREQQFRQTKHITLEEITRRRAVGNFRELNIIIRGDVDGSVEALAGSLLKLSTDEVQVNIIAKGVGAINEADVTLAMASDAVILAFNVRPNAQARQLAEREEIDIRTYSVIYDAINDVKDALEGLLSPEIKEEILGTGEVREVFKVSKVGMVAGCYATSGKITKNDPVRIIRDGVVIYNSTLTSLKRYKDDVKEVQNGYEFGCMVENYNDIKVGDVIESYREKQVKRTLS